MCTPEQSLSIVMAAYNEEETLPACVDRTLEFLRLHVEDGELIIVDDGSTDGTSELIDEISRQEPKVRAYHLARNSGMGAALLRGYAEALKHWVTMLPADGQLDAFDLLSFFAASRDADLVTSLYRNRRSPLHRKVLSIGLRALTTVIVGARARTEGTYLVRRDVLEALNPCSHSFLLNLEIPIRARRGGYRVRTVYMNVHDRLAGESKAATPRRILQTFTDHFSLRLTFEKERLRRVRGLAKKDG